MFVLLKFLVFFLCPLFVCFVEVSLYIYIYMFLVCLFFLFFVEVSCFFLVFFLVFFVLFFVEVFFFFLGGGGIVHVFLFSPFFWDVFYNVQSSFFTIYVLPLFKTFCFFILECVMHILVL